MAARGRQLQRSLLGVGEREGGEREREERTLLTGDPPDRGGIGLWALTCRGSFSAQPAARSCSVSS